MTTKTVQCETREQIRLRNTIIEAKALCTYPDINWDDCCWNITRFEKPHAHVKCSRNIYFSPYSSSRGKHSRNHASYEQPFADFAKAIIRTRTSERHISFKGHTHILIALRYLYEALIQTGNTDPTRLIRKTFGVALTLAKARVKGWTVYHVGKALQEISDWIDERELTRTEINFLNPIACPSKGDGLDAESQARGLLKMPSRTALDALADISNNPQNENERILMRIIDLLAVGGFRIGEVLSLPSDCWVEATALDDMGQVRTDAATGNPIIRCGIRYWPEKGGDPYVKWLPDLAVPLAKRAVDDLQTLCADARAVAETLERTSDRLPVPGSHKPDDLVSHTELMQILGLKVRGSVNAFLRDLGVIPAGQRKMRTRFGFVYRVQDIELGLLKRRPELVILRRAGGKVQMLSQSLCVMFRNQFRPRHATLRFLPELIGVGQVNDALGNRNTNSVFAGRSLTEPDGSPMKIRTHQFRHWLNTLLDRGGLTDVELARWSGRRNINENAAYKHGSVEQRVNWARKMIREGNLRGAATDVYDSISDPIEKEEFLETFVNVALFTPYGVCIHDYAIDPCPYHLNCLGGCSEYLRTKGDKDEQKNIRDVRDFHLIQLTRVKTATTDGADKIKSYQSHCERIIEGAESALAVDNGKIADGQLVRVFPKGKPAGKPIHLEDGRTI